MAQQFRLQHRQPYPESIRLGYATIFAYSPLRPPARLATGRFSVFNPFYPNFQTIPVHRAAENLRASTANSALKSKQSARVLRFLSDSRKVIRRLWDRIIHN